MSAYRQNPLANLTPVVKNILIINILFFVATYILEKSGIDLNEHLAAYYFNSPNFRLWQVITYMFMHANLFHIFFNMFALFVFGPALESLMGAKRFLQFYFFTGIGALLLQWLVQAFQIHAITGAYAVYNGDVAAFAAQPGFEQLQQVYGGPILGASGAIFGLLVAFGMLFPNVELFIMFIPLPVKAKYAVIGYILIELYSGVASYSGDNVAHFAHLGGALFGFILIKLWGLRKPNNFFN